jgi:hypothetical protein
VSAPALAWAICGAPANRCAGGRRRRCLTSTFVCKACGSEMRIAKNQAPPELTSAEWWTLLHVSGDSDAAAKPDALNMLTCIGLIERTHTMDGSRVVYTYHVTDAGRAVIRKHRGEP